MRLSCRTARIGSICLSAQDGTRFRDHESVARSLREGVAEMFTLQRLQIPASLHKYVARTSIIESPQSGVQRRANNVARWRDSDMIERWVASAVPTSTTAGTPLKRQDSQEGQYAFLGSQRTRSPRRAIKLWVKPQFPKFFVSRSYGKKFRI